MNYSITYYRYVRYMGLVPVSYLLAKDRAVFRFIHRDNCSCFPDPWVLGQKLTRLLLDKLLDFVFYENTDVPTSCLICYGNSQDFQNGVFLRLENLLTLFVEHRMVFVSNMFVGMFVLDCGFVFCVS